MMSPQEAERIHEVSLRLLADPGVRVEHDAPAGWADGLRAQRADPRRPYRRIRGDLVQRRG